MSKKVVSGDFGGHGPRQVLGEAMKTIDECRAALVVTIKENGDVELWSNDLSMADLALIATRVQGHALVMVNQWEEPE